MLCILTQKPSFMKKLILTLLAASLPFSAYATTYNFSTSTSGTPASPATVINDIPHGTAVTWALSGSDYTSLLADVKTSGKTITGATLTIKNIYDWTTEANDPADALFINILSGLSTANTGVNSKQFSSTQAGSNDPAWNSSVYDPFLNNTSTTGDYNDILKAGPALAFNDAQNNSLLKAATADTKTGTPTTITWSDPSGGAARNFDLVIQLSAANLTLLDQLLIADPDSNSPDVGFGFAAECHYYDSGVTFTVNTGPATVPEGGSTLALLGLAMTAIVGVSRFKTKA
jgi:hypothetical protein